MDDARQQQWQTFLSGALDELRGGYQPKIGRAVRRWQLLVLPETGQCTSVELFHMQRPLTGDFATHTTWRQDLDWERFGAAALPAPDLRPSLHSEQFKLPAGFVESLLTRLQLTLIPAWTYMDVTPRHTRYELSIYADGSSVVYRWWDQLPLAWRQLGLLMEDVAREMNLPPW